MLPANNDIAAASSFDEDLVGGTGSVDPIGYNSLFGACCLGEVRVLSAHIFGAVQLPLSMAATSPPLYEPNAEEATSLTWGQPVAGSSMRNTYRVVADASAQTALPGVRAPSARSHSSRADCARETRRVPMGVLSMANWPTEALPTLVAMALNVTLEITQPGDADGQPAQRYSYIFPLSHHETENDPNRFSRGCPYGNPLGDKQMPGLPAACADGLTIGEALAPAPYVTLSDGANYTLALQFMADNSAGEEIATDTGAFLEYGTSTQPLMLSLVPVLDAEPQCDAGEYSSVQPTPAAAMTACAVTCDASDDDDQSEAVSAIDEALIGTGDASASLPQPAPEREPLPQPGPAPAPAPAPGPSPLPAPAPGPSPLPAPAPGPSPLPAPALGEPTPASVHAVESIDAQLKSPSEAAAVPAPAPGPGGDEDGVNIFLDAIDEDLLNFGSVGIPALGPEAVPDVEDQITSAPTPAPTTPRPTTSFGANDFVKPTPAPTAPVPIDTPTHMPTALARSDGPVSAPTDAPGGRVVPSESPVTPTDAPGGRPIDPQTEAPVVPPTKSPITPTDAPGGRVVPSESPVIPTDAPGGRPTDPQTEAPVVPPTKSPITPTDAPGGRVVPSESPVIPTDAPGGRFVPTDAPTSPRDSAAASEPTAMHCPNHEDSLPIPEEWCPSGCTHCKKYKGVTCYCDQHCLIAKDCCCMDCAGRTAEEEWIGHCPM